MSELYIGLMSGTSMDGIDAALVRFDESSLQMLATYAHDYPAELQERLRTIVATPSTAGSDEIGELDSWIGHCFRDAAVAVMRLANVDAAEVCAIGSHGQTIRHRPDAGHRFTLQIGDPSIIATGTGIDTVADFRRADMSLGGQGAPLAPAFHRWWMSGNDDDIAVVNIGGIANVTAIASQSGSVIGFDSGPGNTLLDAWIRQHRSQAFDSGGAWAACGRLDEALLSTFLADPWFDKAPPKSTGPEYFNMAWLSGHDIGTLAPEDVQATLCELTAASIASSITRWAPDTGVLYVCGGGAHNSVLIERLRARLAGVDCATSDAAGLSPDWVEAVAFAWLARQRVHEKPGNLPTVTGASRDAVLGALYKA